MPSIHHRRENLVSVGSSDAPFYQMAADKVTNGDQFPTLLKPPMQDPNSIPHGMNPNTALIAYAQNWRMERTDTEQRTWDTDECC